jgi:outer membrane lipoprotein SlyB
MRTNVEGCQRASESHRRRLRRGGWPLLLAAIALVAVGCGTKKPVLYPNRHLQEAGARVAERDMAECMELADAYVGTASAAEKAGTGTVVGGGVGGATGAAGGAAAGAIRGNAGRGAAIGAAGGAAAGATAGLIRGLFSARDPDPLYKRYVVTCLGERGYQTIGWK